MKRFASSLLILGLAVTAFAPVAKAQNASGYQLTPFNISTLAYQGRLDSQGVPGYNALEAGVNSGSITADQVVQAAIESGRLPEAALQDDNFVSSVNFALQSLTEHSTK